MTDSTIATGYIAPLHGRGASGLFLSGVVSIVVAVAGATGPSVPLISFGLAGLMASGAGLYLYWSEMRKKPAIQVFADRIEFLRGHRRGTVLFSEVTDVRGIQWGGSIYPYTRPSRFLILETKDGEWQFGPEVANCAELQESVVQALRDSRGLVTSSEE